MPSTRGKVTAPDGMTQSDRDKTLAAAYTAASQHLRDEHREEFNGYYAEEAAKRGVTWEPRLSKEEKARDQLKALLQEFPGLWDELGDSVPD